MSRGRVLCVVAFAACVVGADAARPKLNASASACGTCHVAQLQSWQRSRHAVAATNAIFRASFDHWPNGWCLTCHAPADHQQTALLGRTAVPGAFRGVRADAPLATVEGVDCAACHVDGDIVLSATAPSAPALAAHAIRHDPRLADERACARCHEFAFQLHTPPWPFAVSDQLAQSTVSEWRASSAARRGVTCQDCHMKRGHDFPGAHDQDWVRAHLTATATQRRDGTVDVVVTSEGAGHRVPTGDPFRRLVFTLCGDAACTRVVHTLTLGRTIRADATSFSVAADQTVPAPADGTRAERRVRTDVLTRVVAWKLELRFGDRRFERLLSAADVGYEVARGVVQQEAR